MIPTESDDLTNPAGPAMVNRIELRIAKIDAPHICLECHSVHVKHIER